MTITNPNVKNLIKILIGAAWLDGKIQPEERDYLHRIAKEKGVANEPEIQPLLYEFRPVKPSECYAWVQEYLGANPSKEACYELLEAISGLIYSDGTVDSEEAKLLNEIQMLDPGNVSQTSNTVVKAIRNVYQRWISKLE
jgi:uncharacterized membrane protein YebE (DUF533 family)